MAFGGGFTKLYRENTCTLLYHNAHPLNCDVKLSIDPRTVILLLSASISLYVLKSPASQAGRII